MTLLHESVSRAVIHAFKQVHAELGHGFLESVYSAAMSVALHELGCRVDREMPVEVAFRGRRVGVFRVDLLVDNRVCVELKVCRTLHKVHEAQLLNYLRASRIEVGLLLNFAPHAEFRRFILTNDRKALRPLSATTRPRSP